MRNINYLLCLLLLNGLLFAKAEVSAELQSEIENAIAKQSTVRAVIFLEDQLDVLALDAQLYREQANARERAYRVITALQNKASETQGEILSFLNSHSKSEVAMTEPFWIANLITVEAIPAVIYALADRNDIRYLDVEPRAQLDDFVFEGPAEKSIPNGHEPGLGFVNADKVWALGYSGSGRLVMNIDSGVDGNHPALAARWRGLSVPSNQAWLGAGTFPNSCPGSIHGTHVMGTIAGMDPATNDTVGVAPAAEWIAAQAIGCGVSTTSAFQWGMNPDGNASTIDDMPDVICNSWFDGTTGVCRAAIYQALFNSVEAAGIAIVFSAGNAGPGTQTITGPKNINTNLVNVFAVANLNGGTPGLTVAGGSSRGPSACGGATPPLLIKPEVGAPGTAVRSAGANGGYALLSGTSMAAPHASGAIALLKEPFPDATGYEIKMALYLTAAETASDLATFNDGEETGSTSGEDNDYGRGIIDIYAAYQFLNNGGLTSPVSPENFAAYSDYLTPTSMQLSWTDPATQINGDPIVRPLRIIISRDGAVIDSVDSGIENYTDTGLIDGETYEYGIYAKYSDSGFRSFEVNSSWVAGGAAQPSPVTGFDISGSTDAVLLKWTNPVSNIDGTPLDDMAGINLYQNGTLITNFTRTSADSGRADSVQFSPVSGYYEWQVALYDNENPQNESELTIELRTPINLNLVDAFADTIAIPGVFWQTDNAEVNDRADNPPSGPYALNLNGTPTTGENVESHPIDMSAQSGNGVSFSYQYQPQGAGNEPPEPADSLRVRLLNDAGEWIRVRAYPGSNLVPFVQETIDLDSEPSGSGSFFHSQFQIRFEVLSSPHPIIPRDDWFVDNIFLGIPEAVAALSTDTLYMDTTEVGQTSSAVVEVQNIGLLDYDVSNIVAGGIFSVDQSSFTVGQSGKVDLSVNFAPQANGNYQGIISIVHNAANGDSLHLVVMGTAGMVTAIEPGQTMPQRYDIAQNYPNPFNPSTTIAYQLPQRSETRLIIYNVLGEKIRTLLSGSQPAGFHQAIWDGRDDAGRPVASGVYLYRFTAGDFNKVKKLMLLR